MRETVRGLVKSFDELADDAFGTLRGNQSADRVFAVASEAADYSRSWHAISLALAIADPSLRRHGLRMAAALAVESAVVNGLLKNIFRRERPPLLDDRAFEVRRPKTRSFPSGHASSATLAAVLLSDAAPKARPLWWGLAAVVAASRVHNRMHHGSDVAAGLVIGTSMGGLVKRLSPLP